MDKAKEFQLKIKGKSISPSTLSVRELLGVIVSVEEAIFALADKDEIANFKQGGGFALTRITKGSAVATLTSVYLDDIRDPFVAVAERGQEPEMLPLSAQRPIGRILDFCAAKRARIEFLSNPDSKQPDGVLSFQKTRPQAPIVVMSGETTIYGVVEKVGGASPRAIVRLLSGERLPVKVSKKLARQLGHRLYEEVGLRGVAKWEMGGRGIVSFEASVLLAYSKKSIVDVFDKLREDFGSCIDHIEDMDSYVDALRGK